MVAHPRASSGAAWQWPTSRQFGEPAALRSVVPAKKCSSRCERTGFQKQLMAETILLVSNLYPPRIVGGAELIAHYQARELQKLGCNIHVFAGEGQLPGSHYAVSRDVCDGIPVERIFLNSQDFSSAFVNFFHPEIEARFLQTLDRVRP